MAKNENTKTCKSCYGKECQFYPQCQGLNCEHYTSDAELLTLMPYEEGRYKNYEEYLENRSILLGF